MNVIHILNIFPQVYCAPEAFKAGIQVTESKTIHQSTAKKEQKQSYLGP